MVKLSYDLDILLLLLTQSASSRLGAQGETHPVDRSMEKSSMSEG